MSKRELVVQEVEQLSESEIDTVLEFLHRMADAHDEASLPMLAAESALAKEWLTPEEDDAWAHL